MTGPQLPYRKSAQADPCRWPEPDADGRCRYCGWPLTRVRSYDAEAGFVIGHYRHRRPRISRGKGAQTSVPDPDEPEYPHEGAPRRTLSAATSSAPDGDAARLSTNRTRGPQPTYPHQPDSNRAFRQRTGAGDRLYVPTPAEWSAWKARWA